MPQFDLVAFDLDGTLIGPTCTISPVVASAVERMGRAGVRGCIVTGRMYRAALPFQRTLRFTVPLICYQGAAIVDAESDTVLRDTPLSNDVVREVIALTAQDGMHLQLYRNDEYYCRERNRFSDIYARLSGVEPVVVASLTTTFSQSPATKAVIIADPPEAERYLSRLRTALSNRAYVTRSYPEFVEVLNPAVDKGDALAFLCSRLGIDLQRVAAIGDAWNDAPLLRRAGYGIAMGTAPQDLRDVAAAVVGSVEEDGVAQAIDGIVLA